ncbi:MAG TPA: aminotransferase class V-fold PLP-dependent enzyme [Candidatus Limnocylindrales bacterium]|nr:aminotransferase class V-fold PLP-dependent enzyme [Candidatus Limnocylindrales bacterium]
MRPYSADSPWDFDPAITYLTHGTYGACPRPVVEYQRALRAELESNPIRFLTRELEGRLDAARREVAAFVNADPEGLVVVPNATTGVATVLESLRLRPGDELLTNDHEYNATVNALETVAARAKARVKIVEIRLPIRHPEEVVEAHLAAVTPHTRVALISHVTSPSGLVFPIETLVRELNRLGVDTLVDAAHAPGMLPLNVRELGAAWWTGNGHKWLCGPKGAGMLYVRADKRADLRPLVTSHGRNDPRADRAPLWKEFDWQGTHDPTAFLSLPEALRVIGSLDAGGWPAHMASNHDKAVNARRLLNNRLGLEPIAPESMLGSMASIALSIEPDEGTTDALSRSLASDDGFEVPVGPFPVRACRVPGQPPARALLRISAQRYNEPSDYERLADALVRRGLAASNAVSTARREPATASGIVTG